MDSETAPLQQVLVRLCKKGVEELDYAASVVLRTSLPLAISNTTEVDAAPPISSSWEHNRVWAAVSNTGPIGHFFIWNSSDRNKSVELTCAFDTNCQQTAVEVAFQQITRLFLEKGLHRISILVQPEQFFFLEVLKNLHFFFEGTLRQAFYAKDQWHDICLFSYVVEEKKPAAAIAPLSQYDWLLSEAHREEADIIYVRAIILKPNGDDIQVLLLKRLSTVEMPCLEEPPGSKLQAGESIPAALYRTVKEQTGLEISQDSYFLTSFDFTTSSGQRVRELVFRVKPTMWKPCVEDGVHGSCILMPLQNLGQAKLHPDMMRILSTYSSALSYESQSCPSPEREATIDLVRPPTIQVHNALLAGLHLEAYASRGLQPIDPFGLALKDSMGKIVGGVTAEISYGCLLCRRIWVDSGWRGLGWGKRLINRAESFARERGCTFALVHVMDWENVGFFQSLGYILDGQHLGFQCHSRQLCLRKQF